MKKWIRRICTVSLAGLGLGYIPLAHAQSLQSAFLESVDNKQVLHLQFSEPLHALPQHFKTMKPSRIVLDFNNVTSSLRNEQLPQTEGLFNGMKIVSAQNRLRTIIDLRAPVIEQLELRGRELSLLLSAAPVVIPVAAPAAAPVGDSIIASVPTKAKKEVIDQDSLTKNPFRIKQIDFRRVQANNGQLTVDLSQPTIMSDIKQKDQQIIVTFTKTRASQNLQKLLDVSDFATPVQKMQTMVNGNDAQIILTMNGNYDYSAYQVDQKFVVSISPMNAQTKAQRDASSKPHYIGEKITLNFQDIKVRAVLQLLSEFTNINIVASDTIKGNITLRLHQVPWDQALDIILKTQGLAKKKMGGVMLVAPIDEMASRDKQELQVTQDVTNLTPVVSELIPVRYAKAGDLATLIKDDKNTLLSTRGHLSTDVRTNTLWVQDTSDKIFEIKRVIDRLDRPVKQVEIEARVVIVNKDIEKNLGIQFGLHRPPHWSGTLNAANKTATGTSIGSVEASDRLNMDLPASPTDATIPSSIGVALAKLGHGFLLDLELSALEEEGGGNIISSPRLMTADQQTARIESGEEIPYQETTSSGATNVAFKKAVLSLEVTPHITPDNKLVMDLEVHQDSRGLVTNNVPAINTRQIRTRVLVENGETVVLGGIYEQTKSNLVKRIPFFGELPGLGWLFRNKQEINNRRELLIFVTPKIVDNKIAAL